MQTFENKRKLYFRNNILKTRKFTFMMKHKHIVFFLATLVISLGTISLSEFILSPRIQKYHHQSQQILNMMAEIQKTPMSKIVSGHYLPQNENETISL